MAPWKCPDCGVWWAGLEHRCQPAGTGAPTWPYQPIGIGTVSTTTPRCTCPEKRGNNYTGYCPIHDVTVTYSPPTNWSDRLNEEGQVLS